MEQEEETGSSEPPQNGLYHVCMCVYLLCAPTPPSTAYQQTVRISYFMRCTIHAYIECSDYSRKGEYQFFGEIDRNSLEKFSLSKTIQANKA